MLVSGVNSYIAHQTSKEIMYAMIQLLDKRLVSGVNSNIAHQTSKEIMYAMIQLKTKHGL